MTKHNERRTSRQIGRMETPSMVGYRHGMSSPVVIGRKLGSVYELPCDNKREIETVLQTLDVKLG